MFNIGYAIVGFVYSRILNQFRKSERGLNIANGLWNIGNQICIALVGVLFFKEKLTAINWAGNILMAIGLGLLIFWTTIFIYISVNTIYI